MATWNAGYEAKPTNADSPTLGDDEIRATRGDARARMENEHLTYNDATAGAESEDFRHREGSARTFYQDGEPANAPSGGTLGDGHLWVDSNANEQLYVHDGTNFVKVTGVLPTGTQTVAGVKTFDDAPVLSGGAQIGELGATLKTKILTLTWAAAISESVAHGLTLSKIRGVSAVPPQDRYVDAIGITSTHIFVNLTQTVTGTSYVVVFYVP